MTLAERKVDSDRLRPGVPNRAGGRFPRDAEEVLFNVGGSRRHGPETRTTTAAQLLRNVL